MILIIGLFTKVRGLQNAPELLGGNGLDLKFLLSCLLGKVGEGFSLEGWALVDVSNSMDE